MCLSCLLKICGHLELHHFSETNILHSIRQLYGLRLTQDLGLVSDCLTYLLCI